MQPARRIITGVIGAAVLLLSTLVFASAPASADYTACGAHTHTDRTRITGGYKVKVRIHYHNCGYRTVRIRPDVANGSTGLQDRLLGWHRLLELRVLLLRRPRGWGPLLPRHVLLLIPKGA